MDPLLEVEDLVIAFKTEDDEVISVDGVGFNIQRREVLGIVGESGCGKSVTALSLMGLLGKNGHINRGTITLGGIELQNLSEHEMRKLRGNEIAMIFQEPMTSLNPILTIGTQLMEPLQLHMKLNRKEAKKKVISWLSKVGIARPESVFYDYPDALSGGMRQRVMIAMAMVCGPSLLIADEPTTALDVTIQDQILELMLELQQSSDTSILLITHDLGVIAEMADRVIVMYAGQIVEEADVFTLFEDPRHPYTQGLLASVPNVKENTPGKRLISIPGNVPNIEHMPTGCRFHTRCPHAMDRCVTELPHLTDSTLDHKVRCWLVYPPLVAQAKQERKDENTYEHK